MTMPPDPEALRAEHLIVSADDGRQWRLEVRRWPKGWDPAPGEVLYRLRPLPAPVAPEVEYVEFDSDDPDDVVRWLYDAPVAPPEETT